MNDNFQEKQKVFIDLLNALQFCDVVSGSNLPVGYAPTQGTLSTIVSLDPGVVNVYLVGFFLKMLHRW